MSHDPEPEPIKNTAGLPKELIDLGCFIEGGQIKIPRANAAKVRGAIDRMRREFKRANRKPDGKPIMTARIPTKRV